ncbi:MAG: phage Gp37/Gp68 family protein [Azoarcus sp.]|nr:phage Gp37/Gp68 family protein [Azoarcus sp.]
MGKDTKIGWCDHTFNPWVGCQKVSTACDNCYAEGWAKRSGLVQWGPHTERRRTSAAIWRKPIKWDAEAECLGIRANPSTERIKPCPAQPRATTGTARRSTTVSPK